MAEVESLNTQQSIMLALRQANFDSERFRFSVVHVVAQSHVVLIVTSLLRGKKLSLLRNGIYHRYYLNFSIQFLAMVLVDTPPYGRQADMLIEYKFHDIRNKL